MNYVNTYRCPTVLAAALLTETGVTIPAHMSYGPSRRWISEKRVCIEDVGSRISENTRRYIESMAMRDQCEAGRMVRDALKAAAAEMAKELLSDWSEVDA